MNIKQIIKEEITKFNEEFLGTYSSDWDKTGEPVEIYSNPKSINRMNPYIRGIIDKQGNVYVADVDRTERFGATTHHDLIGFLKEKGITPYHTYFSNDYQQLNLVPIIRQGGTNRFGVTTEIGGFRGVDFIDKQLDDILKKGMQKNPTMILVPEIMN